MLFFGTFSVLSSDEKPKDPVIGHAIDGSAFHLSEVRALSRFIASDREDLSGIPNFCNDGVIRNDLLRNGLADLLVASYFDPLKKGLSSRVERAKKFRPYVHPGAQILSAKAVWEHFLPSMNQDIALVQAETEITPKTFSLLSHLYQSQAHFPAETLRRILLIQQRQYKDLAFDPKLQRGDLSLFGFHTLSDWFGDDFIDLVSEFILNGAKLAEQKGFRVSLEEAKGDLSVIFEESMKQMKTSGTSHFPSKGQHLRKLGFDQQSAARLWRNVLLFRRYFQRFSQATFMDRLAYTDFASYVKETALLDLYQWPSALHLKTLDDLAQFQMYLSALFLPEKNPLHLPSQILPIEVVKQKFPELAPHLYRAKVTAVALPQVALRAPLREVWDWECDEKNWEFLKNQFRYLSNASTRAERFKVLETLDPKNRADIDTTVRVILTANHTEWISEALAQEPSEEKKLSIQGTSLSHVEKPEMFFSLLSAASNGDEEAKQKLLSYSDDGKVVYRIENIESLSSTILTFKEAKESGVLSEMTNRVLQAEYIKLRVRHPEKFQDKKGEWKPLSEVKDTLIKHVFSDLFKEIASLEKKEWTDTDYALYRLLAPTRVAQEDLKKNSTTSGWVQTEGDPLVQQFKLEKRECNIQRTSKEEWMNTLAFTMVSDSWSGIQVSPDGNIRFFYMKERAPADEPILEQLSFGKETIGADAQRYVAERFLESLKLKKSIIIPLQGEQE